MTWCADKGIPHSEFLSWAPEDRAKLIAYLHEEGDRCFSCGTYGWEWEADKRAYMAVDKFCPGCYVRKAASEDNDALPGTTVELAPYDKETAIANDKRRYAASQEKTRREIAALKEGRSRPM